MNNRRHITAQWSTKLQLTLHSLLHCAGRSGMLLLASHSKTFTRNVLIQANGAQQRNNVHKRSQQYERIHAKKLEKTLHCGINKHTLE
jgi:hypothetical protein